MPFDLTKSGLQRFVDAQDLVYAAVCKELKAETKTTHWMGFIFPQLKGLGRNAIARHFGIESKEEALAIGTTPFLERDCGSARNLSWWSMTGLL